MSSQWWEDCLRGDAREVPLVHARMSADARCAAIVEEFVQRISFWCRQRGIAPHRHLDIMASMALALGSVGRVFGPDFERDMLERAQTLDAEGGSLGLPEAARQVLDYLSDSSA